MASFTVEAMVCGIHELIRGHNFRVLVEIRENLENLSTSKIDCYTIFRISAIFFWKLHGMLCSNNEDVCVACNI